MPTQETGHGIIILLLTSMQNGPERAKDQTSGGPIDLLQRTDAGVVVWEYSKHTPARNLFSLVRSWP